MPPRRAADAPPPTPERAAGATGGADHAGPPVSPPALGTGDAGPPPIPPPFPGAGPRPAGRVPPRRAPWVTVLLTVVGVGGYLLLQSAVGLAILVPAAAREMAGGGLAPRRLLDLMWEQAGLTVWVGIAVAAPAGIALFVWLARWQGPGGGRLRLGLLWPRWREVLGWLLAVLAYGWFYERASSWFERPPLPPVMEQVFTTAGWLPALLAAVVVLAPAFEELAFRGFCLGGLARLGPVAAVALSSALFAVIHLQYDPFDLIAVLGLGVLFGAARWQSGSTLLAFGLHAFHNALASLQALWTVGGAAP